MSFVLSVAMSLQLFRLPHKAHKSQIILKMDAFTHTQYYLLQIVDQFFIHSPNVTLVFFVSFVLSVAIFFQSLCHIKLSNVHLTFICRLSYLLSKGLTLKGN